MAVSIILLDRRFQPLLVEMQNVPINDATGDAPQEAGSGFDITPTGARSMLTRSQTMAKFFLR